MRLVVKDVSVTLGGQKILDTFNVVARSFESLAIVGPSGAGKSTLLSVMAGHLTPAVGAVALEDEASGAHHRQPVVSWIVQASPLLDRRTALANAALGPVAAGMDLETAHRLAGHALTELGLTALFHKPVYKLSGGERQRVAVARTIATRPDVILADEPTASLDAASRSLVVSALQTAALEGAIVVVATHDPAVAESCSRHIDMQPTSR